MKIDYLFYLIIIAGIGYLIYKDFNRKDVLPEKFIALTEDIYEINKLLVSRDSLDETVLSAVKKLQASNRATTNFIKIKDPDSLVRAANELLSE